MESSKEEEDEEPGILGMDEEVVEKPQPGVIRNCLMAAENISEEEHSGGK